MSVTQNPITGRSSGAFGTAILQTQYGRNILRSKPLEVRNPRSAAQLSQRAIITKAGQMVKYMNSFLIKLYAGKTINMPASSWAVKDLCANCLSAVGETVTVDSTKLLTINDEKNIAALLTGDRSVSNKVALGWDQSLMEAKTGENKQLYGLCYDVATGIFYRENAATTTGSESIVFDVPGNNSSKHFVIILTSESGLTKVDVKKALD